MRIDANKSQRSGWEELILHLILAKRPRRYKEKKGKNSLKRGGFSKPGQAPWWQQLSCSCDQVAGKKQRPRLLWRKTTDWGGSCFLLAMWWWWWMVVRTSRAPWGSCIVSRWSEKKWSLFHISSFSWFHGSTWTAAQTKKLHWQTWKTRTTNFYKCPSCN